MTNKYVPQPLNTEHVTLNVELHSLVEQLAEHVHDLWASERLKDGWAYGSQRCDKSKSHPCLVPYSSLPESEKKYDRNVVLGTVKAIVALGYELNKADITQQAAPADAPKARAAEP